MDVYDIYSTFWIQIVRNGKAKQVTEGLKVCRTDSEIIAYIRQLLDDSGLLKQIQFKPDAKNETKAIECRKLGNKYFHPSIKKYIAAIEGYNESIALSNVGSENLAIAYANRSAICFELKEYYNCLENIRLALENPYPERLIPKLLQRKQSCLEMINNNHRPTHSDMILCEPKLCSKPNPKIPFISDCLELKKNDIFGRHLVTNIKLTPGDFVAIEKSFSKMLLPNLRYMNCDYCLEDKFLILIPCHHCSITMFCSEMCQQKAYQSYHRIECSVNKYLQNLFTKVILMALRTTTITISSFDYDLSNLLQHVQTLEGSSLNPFDIDWTNTDSREVYSTVHMFATNQTQRSASDLVQRSIFCIVMSETLLNNTPLISLCGSNESYRDLIRVLVFRHSQTSPVSMHTMSCINYFPNEIEQFKDCQLACASFPIQSLINHSCEPNIQRITIPNGRIAMIVLRPIEKGGQLFDNYGYHHCLETLSQRKVGLWEQYQLLCRCKACNKDYPLYYDLKHIKLPLCYKYSIAENFQAFMNHDAAWARKIFAKCCKILKDFDCQYPSYELSSVQEDFLRCLHIIYSAHSQIFKYQGLCCF
ncbi:SET and MYND domain-containing protein 4-like [Malaya genurostris]|uniref:SET and MYND domain-containing protein 4-like n=1 Tax=Malaya genurostris TaxID=325434 RepID=UPI0026F3F875|nr:SET and MYND domain-containing protein 4-like [Malaya genurostris]